MARSIVTGGAGFIGSHLVDALVAAGDAVLVIDDLSSGSRANLAGAEAEGDVRLAEGDIADAEFIAATVAAFEPERAFHLAAQADVRRAVADPAFDARVNVVGTINLLEALRAVGGCPVVFASTGGAIYGEGDGQPLPLTEGAPLQPETGYGASKLAGEAYLGVYRRLHGIRGLALRLGNVYGPRQDPHGEAGVVAIFCGRIAADRRPVVFGDGRQTRDYVFVADVVAAMVAGAERLAADPDLEGPYNVGTGAETTVLELAEGLAAVAGRPLEPELAPARKGEILRIAIDPAAAGSDLGWTPATALERGLRATYESVTAASGRGA